MTDQATDNTPDPKAVEAATVEETPDPTPDTAPSAADPSGDITESAPGETAESPESAQPDSDAPTADVSGSYGEHRFTVTHDLHPSDGTAIRRIESSLPMLTGEALDWIEAQAERL